MPAFHFRVRFRLPEDSTLGSEERTLRITSPSGRWTYILDASDGETLKDSQWFLIKDGDGGFDTYDDALKAGRHVKNAVMWWGAKTRVGVDCGNDSTNAWVTQYYIDQVREEQGIRLLNELHGLQVYEEDPELPTQFVASSVQPKILKGIEDLDRHFCQAVDAGLEFTDRETLAFELYGLSHFEAAERARFLTLVTAIESVSQPKARSAEASAHVEKLIRLTQDSGLPDAEIASLVGSLNWLRNESISKTGRDLVEALLGDAHYGDKVAKKFFEYCYALRSEFVHNGKPADDVPGFNSLVAELDRLVADLLAASVAFRSMPHGVSSSA